MAGRVVVLNGSSSAGKTSLALALQDRLPETWLVLGVDTLIAMLPRRLHMVDEGLTFNADGSVVPGSAFREAQQQWRGAVATLVRDGANVIVDEVLLRGGEEQAEWQVALDGLAVTWVAVRCDPGVAEARELARGDRFLGMARHQSAVVHVGVDYDLEVDTTAMTPEDAAAEIVVRL